MRHTRALARTPVHFLAVGELRFDLVIHYQKVALARGVHAQGVMNVAGETNAGRKAHLSLASSSAQKVFTTLPDGDVVRDGSNTPSHCRNAIAGSGEAWGSALRIASRTASFSFSPLQRESKTLSKMWRPKESERCSAPPARRRLNDGLDELRPSGRDWAGIVVEETDCFERIHGGAEAPVAQGAPVHALHALEAVLLNIGQRVAVVELLQLVRGVHADCRQVGVWRGYQKGWC